MKTIPPIVPYDLDARTMSHAAAALLFWVDGTHHPFDPEDAVMSMAFARREAAAIIAGVQSS